MKLISKIISSASAITLLGTIVPITVSCSCSSNTFSIEYAQDINCRDKSDKKTYKSIDKVRTAINNKINVETEQEKEINVNDLNSKLIDTKNPVFQNLYFEFIYNQANISEGFKLTGWKYEEGNNWSFVLNDKPSKNVMFKYNIDNDKIIITDGANIKFDSWTYHLCKGVNNERKTLWQIKYF